MTKRYTDGKFKLMRDGAPYYCAPWVAELSPVSRADMYRGTAGSTTGGASKAQRETQAQMRHPQTTYLPFLQEAAE